MKTIRNKIAFIAVLLLSVNFSQAQSEKQTNTIEVSSSLGTLKQINAGLLNVGYTEAGPATGSPVILLHGWPYDIHSYQEVVPILVAKGYRVITPYLRGFGTTRFLSDATFRNGQQAALAEDVIALMDALKIKKATQRSCFLQNKNTINVTTTSPCNAYRSSQSPRQNLASSQL